MASPETSGNSEACGGYLKVQRHPRNAVASFGFAVVTAAVFSAALAVPSVTQAQLTGYKYPAKQVRHTKPQDGWLETATHDWSVDRTPYSLDQRMLDRAALTYRYDGYPATDWVYQAINGWDESRFQNNSGERTPSRAALKFRYPLASSGFATDGSSSESWDVSKFPNISCERTAERRLYDPRYEFHKFPFGLLDARVVMPAIDQLVNSERSQGKGPWPLLDQPASDWIYTSIPPFDARLFIQVSAPTRMAEHDKLDTRLASFYNDMSWLKDVLSLPDPSAGRIHRRTAKGWQRVWFG